MTKANHNDPANLIFVKSYEFLLNRRNNSIGEPDITKLRSLGLPEPLPYSSETEEKILKSLNPENFGWGLLSEYPRIDWIAAVLSNYLIYRQIPISILIKFLKAINYYGLFDLFDVFDSVSVVSASTKEKFDFFKALAKHYKGKGELDKAQEFYRKAINIALDSIDFELFPYSLVLLAKLYSDYWQRKGLQLAFNEIAFNRIKRSNNRFTNISRALQICIDSYAKEIFSSNPILGEKLFKRLLSGKYQNQDINNRLLFRYYECKVSYSLKLKDFKKTAKFLKLFESTIYTIQNNPKAFYIRRIQLLGFYRTIIAENDMLLNKSGYLFKRIKQLQKDEAIIILDEAITNAESFKDIKFFALAYYEKSFWLFSNSRDETEMIDLRLQCLQESYTFLHKFEKSAINNKTYVNVIEQLAKLHVQKKNWDKALEYYNTLYDYLFFLTQVLNADSEQIENFITQKIVSKEKSFYSEFEGLNKKEIRLVKESLLTDYKELTNQLMSYGENIRVIQRQHFNHFAELLLEHSNLFAHDIKSNITNIHQAFTSMNKIRYQLLNDYEIDEKIAQSENEIIKAFKNISNYEKYTIDEVIYPKEVDITKEIVEYISFAKKHSLSNVNIKYISNGQSIKAQMLGFLINRIMVNLLENSIQVGKRNLVGSINIQIGITRSNNQITLLFYDNCGDFEFFEKIIKKLNNNDIVTSKKNSDGKGNGLIKIKHLLNNNQNWELLKVDKSDIKCLRIPLL